MSSASFHRTYGGIAICVARLAEELVDKGCVVGLWAPDGTATTSDVVSNPRPGLKLLEGALDEALSVFGKVDVIHDNGIWLPYNHRVASLARKAKAPRIVSVHGMLEPWAVRHKSLKKMLAWHLYQKRDLENAARIHATAESEVDALRGFGVRNKTLMIPNGTDLPQFPDTVTQNISDMQTKTALFLSRLHPKKGLPMLIEAWARIAPKDWVLKIAGPDEGGHSGLIQKLIDRWNLGGHVTLLGGLNAWGVSRAYAGADLFVLPTHSENFGMVVVEALAHGVPVLTTTGAPWRELMDHRCGWWVEPTVEDIENGLRKAFQMSQRDRIEMGLRGRNLVESKYTWSPIADQFMQLYDHLRLSELEN